MPIEVDPALVRGLDYYTHTAFEFVTTHIGAQGTVLGGGRYDGLIASWAVRPRPASAGPAASSGWSCCCNDPAPLPRAGRDRPARALRPRRGPRPCPSLRRSASPSSRTTRQHETAYAARQQAQRPRRPDLGDNELAKGVAQLKDLDSGEQREVALDALAGALKA